MQGRKASRLAWLLLVCAFFDLGTAAIDEKSSKNSDDVTTARPNESTDKGDTSGNKTKSSDLTGSETSYSSFFGYPNTLFYGYTPSVKYAESPFIKTAELDYLMKCGDGYINQCQNSRYRTINGTCNNLHNPTWGAAHTRFQRLVYPKYGDGIQAPTRSVSGGDLPLARMISFTLFPNVTIKDHKLTLAAMQWGQLMSHDMAMVDGTTQSKMHAIRCCTDDGSLIRADLVDTKCYPIVIPYNDPNYSKSFIQCIEFIRSTTDLDRGCRPRYKPAAEQLTVVTHFLDLSMVYGSDDEMANNLRSGIAGRMRAEIRSNREWLPSPMNKTSLCDVESSQETCYLAGDVRVNQNPQLTILQIMLLREHNRIAGELARLNPHWTDETIYQETRRIVIAENQHISYYEWLPLFLGVKQTYDGKILYNTDDYVNDYNPHIDPSVLNEHSGVAFRYFHSLVAGSLELINKQRQSAPFALRLSDHYNRPGIIEENGNMDHLTRGMAYQPEWASDKYFDAEITVYLFRNHKKLGADLRSIDIHRNRDHGIASYNDYREYCGLPRAHDWNDFSDYIAQDDIQKLSSLYAYPDDVDLTVGGALESHVPGTLSGPTFLCIMLEQFYRTRVGDRYWYESGDHDLAFTREQLAEIRKASISRLFCDNGNNIEVMQPKGFELVNENNPLVKCEDLPSINLALWKDYAPEASSQYDTHLYGDFSSYFSFYKK